MKKEFYFICQVFYPDEVSTAGLFTNLCEILVKKNINVKVICAQPSYDSKERQKKRVIYKGINISYLPSTNYNKNSILGRIINYLTFSFSLILKLLFSKSKEPIFTTTNPPFLGIIVVICCAIRKRNFSYIVQDIYPEGLIKLGKLKENSSISKVWKIVNKFILKRSHKVIIIGRDMFKWVEETYMPAKEKTTYIPIWQDDQLVQPHEFSGNPFVIENNLQDYFIIQYSGNMGLWNQMREFAIASNVLNNSSLCFTFIGDGIKKNELERTIDPTSKTKVIYFPFQLKSKLGFSLTACHVALVSLAKGLEGIAVPSKIMGILAAGIPVIGMVPNNSEIANIIKENNCGFVNDPEDVDGLIYCIKSLYENTELRKKMGENGRNAFLKKYSTKVVAEKYIHLI